MRSEVQYDTVCSVKEITDNVRSIINSRQQKVSDGEVLELIEELVLHDGRTQLQSYQAKGEVVNGVFNATRKELDLLQPYADDPTVSEIMVNGTEAIFIERNGRVEKTGIRFEQREVLEEIIRRLAGKVYREINELNPIVDARLSDGSRVHAVYRNIAVNGPILSIRRFPEKKITMQELIAYESLPKDAAVFLEKMVQSGYNIFISGGTSSGKTTFLNALSGFIPKDERVIVIEDAAELQIIGIDNLVRMESKTENAQGKGEITIRQLIRASLRMRPDRIIVGEVRGEEVLDMVQAMNTGHDGSLSTGHANSASGMLARLETMYLMAAEFPIEAIRRQIAGAIDLIVHLSRMPDKTRKVVEITEICGVENGSIAINPLYCYKQGMGLERTANPLKQIEKLARAGLSL